MKRKQLLKRGLAVALTAAMSLTILPGGILSPITMFAASDLDITGSSKSINPGDTVSIPIEGKFTEWTKVNAALTNGAGLTVTMINTDDSQVSLGEDLIVTTGRTITLKVKASNSAETGEIKITSKEGEDQSGNPVAADTFTSDKNVVTITVREHVTTAAFTSIAASVGTLTYGVDSGNATELAKLVAPSGTGAATYSFRLKGADSGDYMTADEFKSANAGTYEIFADIEENETYMAEEKFDTGISLEIEKAAADVSDVTLANGGDVEKADGGNFTVVKGKNIVITGSTEDGRNVEIGYGSNETAVKDIDDISAADKGTYKIYAKIAEGDNSEASAVFTDTGKTLSITNSKATFTYSGQTEFDYDGTDHAAVVESGITTGLDKVEAASFTIKKVNGENEEAATEIKSSGVYHVYVASLTGDNAGDYIVDNSWYATVTVTGATLTETDFEENGTNVIGKSIEYDESPHNPKIILAGMSGKVDSVEYYKDGEKATDIQDVGTYSVRVTAVSGNDNLSLPEEGYVEVGTVTITAMDIANAKITISSASPTVEDDLTATTVAGVSSDVVTYKWYRGEISDDKLLKTESKAVGVGSGYTVEAEDAGAKLIVTAEDPKGNYTGVASSETAVVAKKAKTASKDVMLHYSKDGTASANISDALTKFGTYTGENKVAITGIDTNFGTDITAAEYDATSGDIKVTFGGEDAITQASKVALTDSLELSYQGYVVTVTVNVTLTNEDVYTIRLGNTSAIIYDGLEHPVSATVYVNNVANEALVATVKYNSSLDAPKDAKASYAIVATYAYTDSNEDPQKVTEEGTLEIKEAPLTVTASSASIMTGESYTPELTYTGFVNGENKSVLSSSYSAAVALGGAGSVEELEAGEYDVEITPDHSTATKNGNYLVTTVNGKLTVSDVHVHNYTETAVEAKAATCTAEGTKKILECSSHESWKVEGSDTEYTTLAAAKEAAKLAKTAHTLEVVTAYKAATSTEAGTKKIEKCSVCGKYFVDGVYTKEYSTLDDAKKVAVIAATGTDTNTNTNTTGGSGGGSSNSTTKTTTNADGTKTTTTTTKSGTTTTVTESTTKTDGSKEVIKTSTDSKTGTVTKTETTTKTDGSKEETKTVTNKDGSSTVTETDTAADKSQEVVVTETTASGDVSISTSTVNASGTTTSAATYEATSDNTVKLDNIESTGKTVTIPATVSAAGDKYKVTRIAAKALANNKKVTKVVIGKNVKVIGKQAFAGDSKLKTISIKGAVKSVGKDAFKGINKKATITIKASKANYKKTVKAIKKSGIAKTVTFKRAK